jgi:hypothetical protein
LYRRREIEVCLGRLLRSLLEAMKHVDAIGQLCSIDDSECASLLAYPNLSDPTAYRRHRFPVARVEPVLYPIELVAALTTGTDGEAPEVIEGIANELDRLHAL